MAITLSIRSKAFFLLLVFTSGWMSLCHCSHADATTKAAIEKHDCRKNKELKEGEQHKVPCEKGKGSCKYKGIEFNRIAKQMAENVVVNPFYFILGNHFFSNLFNTSVLATDVPLLYVKAKWRGRYTPNLLLLKQSFLI